MSDQLSLFPECGHFAEDVFERAKALLASNGSDAPTFAAIRSTDDVFDDEERAWWIEVSRACKCLLHPSFTAMRE
jgi:hypothetical protein